jgi:hypothetical protein
MVSNTCLRENWTSAAVVGNGPSSSRAARPCTADQAATSALACVVGQVGRWLGVAIAPREQRPFRCCWGRGVRRTSLETVPGAAVRTGRRRQRLRRGRRRCGCGVRRSQVRGEFAIAHCGGYVCAARAGDAGGAHSIRLAHKDFAYRRARAAHGSGWGGITCGAANLRSVDSHSVAGHRSNEHT